MKIFKILFFMIWLTIFLTNFGQAHDSGFPNSASARSMGSASLYNEKKEESDDFFRAKKYIYQRKWQKARQQLENYIKNHPSSRLNDEALYWLSHCYNKLSRTLKNTLEMIELKEMAIKTLDALIRKYKNSHWRDDSMALRIEIAGELVLIGKEKYITYIKEEVQKNNQKEYQIKILALSKLIESEPETTIPILVKLLEKEKNPRIRKEVVRLMGRNYSREVMDILKRTIKNDGDKNVRDEAVYWLDRIKVRLIPVKLNYYVLSARLADGSDIEQLKEKTLTPFKLNLNNRFLHISQVKKKLENIFHKRLAWFKGYANVRDFDFEGSSWMAHDVRNVNIRVIKSTIKKQSNKITGRVLFTSLKPRRKYYGNFEVDRNNDKLFIFRKGNIADMLVLQFESGSASSLDKEDAVYNDQFSIKKKSLENHHESQDKRTQKPVYYVKFNDIMGCVVYSTLNSINSVYKKGLMDFSEAKAEIPGPGGNWVLRGHLLLIEKERRFLARKGILTSPKGKVVGAGLEVSVSVDNPKNFNVTGKKLSP